MVPVRPNPLIPIVTIAVCTVTLVMLALFTWRWRGGSLPSEQLDTLRLVHERILQDYVFEQDPEQLVYRAIEGMVGSLDSYSKFVPPSAVHDFEGAEFLGTYDGIGIRQLPADGVFTVFWPIPGGPAELAGLRVGDRITAVDAIPIEANDGAEQIRGRSGTSTTLSVRRDEGEAVRELEIVVERAPVWQSPITWAHVLDEPRRIGYLRVDEFQRRTVEMFDSAIVELTEDLGGAELGGLVIDVRANPGGLLTETVKLSNRFLQSGRIVSLRRRDGQTVEIHDADPALCTLPSVPVVILIDRSSASAAEVFAAALQDHGRARVIGERSYGKGVVQQIYQWPNRDFRLKLTASHYYTPKGRNLSKTLRRSDDGEDPGGVDPDVPIALTRDDVLRHQRAIGSPEPPRGQRGAVEALAIARGLTPPRPPSPDDDPCLAAALRELTVPESARAAATPAADAAEPSDAEPTGRDR